MMLNPYAKFLGDRAPQKILSETPDRLEAIVQWLGPAGIERSLAPGKWSVREIIIHLADCEIAFSFRLRQALAEDSHTIQPFDQETWAANYANYETGAALSLFSSLRLWNLALCKNLNSETLAKPVTHPERGTMTFATILETMAGHDLNHLQQLEAISAQSVS